MAESNRKSKKKTGNPFSRTTTFSRLFFSLMKWVGMLGGAWIALRLLIFPMISSFVHHTSDNDKWIQKHREWNESAKGYLNDFIPREFVPHTASWSKHVDNAIMFDVDAFMLKFAIVLGIIALFYGFTILYRHRLGEMSPFSDDLEARTFKRRIVKNIGATRRTAIDEENREIKRLESIARFRLRWMRVEIHTSYQKGSVKPVKSYYIRISRVRNNDEVNQRVLKKIKNLDESLSSIKDVSFGAMATSSNRRYYTFQADKQINKVKESIFVKWRRRKARKATGSDTGSEYAFPLTLFTDNSGKIEEKREKAEEKTEEYQESVRIYLLSEKVQVNTSDAFTGNTSVELQYSLPSYITGLPNLESLQSGLDASLNIQGTLVTLRGSKLNVIVPLPDDCVIPIDVKSMIESEF